MGSRGPASGPRKRPNRVAETSPMKAPDAFRTISEVAEELDLPQHVLRFWETRFKQIRPMKRGGGRRYYRPEDIDLLRGVRLLLYGEGFTIRGVQRLLKDKGVAFVVAVGQTGSVQTVTAAERAPEPKGYPTQRHRWRGSGRRRCDRAENGAAPPAPMAEGRLAPPPAGPIIDAARRGICAPAAPGADGGEAAQDRGGAFRADGGKAAARRGCVEARPAIEPVAGRHYSRASSERGAAW